MWTWIWFMAFIITVVSYITLYRRVLGDDERKKKHNKITQLTIFAALASCGEDVKSGDIAASYLTNLEVLLKEEDFIPLVNTLLEARGIPAIRRDVSSEEELASVVALRDSISLEVLQIWDYLDNPDKQEAYKLNERAR